MTHFINVIASHREEQKDSLETSKNGSVQTLLPQVTNKSSGDNTVKSRFLKQHI